jgi:hypothetical protein
MNCFHAFDQVLNRVCPKEYSARMCPECVNNQVLVLIIKHHNHRTEGKHALQNRQRLEASKRTIRERSTYECHFWIASMRDAEYFFTARGTGDGFDLVDMAPEAPCQKLAAERGPVGDQQT